MILGRDRVTTRPSSPAPVSQPFQVLFGHGVPFPNTYLLRCASRRIAALLISTFSLIALLTSSWRLALATPGQFASPLPGWQRISATGEGITTLITPPSTTGLVAALGSPMPETDLRTSVKRSVDGGHTWQALDRGLPLDLRLVTGTVAPTDTRSMIVSGVGGLFRLDAGASTWEPIRVPLPTITAIRYDQSDPNHLIAGTELHGNFITRDGGSTWIPSSLGLPHDRYGTIPGAISLAQLQSDSAVWLMATAVAPGVFRSVNGGSSWKPVTTGLAPGGATSVSFHSEADGTAFVTSDRGMALSTDRGQTWTPVASLPPGISPVAVVTEPASPQTWMVVGARGSVVRSTNRGESWVELPSLPRPVGPVFALSPSTMPRATTSPGIARIEGVPVLLAAAAGGVWSLALPPTTPATASRSELASGGRYIQATEHNISARFASAYDRLGGFERFGFPRSEAFVDQGLLVQWFQRGRLEYRPDLQGSPYEVQISLLGDLLLTDRPVPSDPIESTSERRYYPETGMTVENAFLRYFDARGGVDALGYPITPEVSEADRPVQYFQRARLEYLREFAGTAREVQLGLIGDEILRQRGWLD